MNSRDGRTSPPAPRIKEQNDVRLTAAKTRVNDRHANATRLDRIGADLEAIHKRLQDQAQRARLVATSTRLEEQLNSFEKIIREAIQAALKGTEVQYSSNHTQVRDDEEPQKNDEKPREETSAEEVVLGTTVDRDDEEPGEDDEEPGEDVSAEEVVLGTTTVFRDDEDPGEDGPPTTSDLYNFDDTDSEDGNVPTPVTNPTPPPASTPFRLQVNTVSGPKSVQDHKPELTFT
ncbi:hypothetical protein THAOC_06862, partial [Thalassiosira oceanica]